MPYQSLYRRYRPHRFDDMVGQQHVVAALRNAVREGRAGHAYLFSGPRGTGKTSTARILAKALNCTNATDGEPCGTCESCQAIDAGSSYDLHELDAASNNGVDAMRDLIAKAALGSPGRTKVYILDEVHMLSTAASNALLKTLEEPPPHVTFVLATTDPQKVLPTIRSRAQHYEFSLIPGDDLANHVRAVAADAGLTVDDEAVAYVVRKGAGSARDTLSALDQVAALGRVPSEGEPLDELLAALVARDTAQALTAVAALLQSGRESRLVGEELLGRLRDAFLVVVGAPVEHLPDGERARVTEVGRGLGPAAITRALESLGEALVEMRQAPDPRVPFEVALIRITRPDLDTSVAALVERVAALERRLAGGPPAPPSSDGLPPAADAPPLDALGTPPAAPGPPSELGEAPERTAAPLSPGAEARRRLQARKGVPRKPQAPADREPSAAGGPHREAGSSPGPPPSSTAGSPPSPPSVASGAAVGSRPPTSGDGPVADGGPPFPDHDTLVRAWTDEVLESLSMRAKARYRAGRFLGAEGEVAVFGLPNEIHRDRCDQLRPEVEGALGRHFGRPVGLRLVVDDNVSASGPSGSGQGPPPFRPASTDRASTSRPFAGRGHDPAGDHTAVDVDDLDVDGEQLDIADVHALPDATDVASGVVDRLLQAFPGSQVVE